MRTEVAKSFPVPLKNGFDYIDDFKLWPDWYVGLTEILDPAMSQWVFPGDSVKFSYRLLGRRVEGTATLDEKIHGEFVKFHTDVPGLPRVHQEWHYATAGTEAFIVKVVLETKEDDPTTLFGRVIDKTMLPRVLDRDLRGSLENLDEIFVAGLHEG